ncbi:hypothetical protein [Cupriavidus basilensis]|uniref:hypothetical protein n=1 Tax=Cupriavidus basilensis TaxID=68895 RepID=UPI003D343BD6
MAREKIEKEWWKALPPLPPVAEPLPNGGRFRLDDQATLNGILSVLQTGIVGRTCCKNWIRQRDDFPGVA